MKLTSMMCLIRHKFGRWRRPSARQLDRKAPPGLLMEAQRGGNVSSFVSSLRLRTCARCGVQEWQYKPRRKSPQSANGSLTVAAGGGGGGTAISSTTTRADVACTPTTGGVAVPARPPRGGTST